MLREMTGGNKLGMINNRYLLQVGESVMVCVGEDAVVFPASCLLQLQDLLVILPIQGRLTG